MFTLTRQEQALIIFILLSLVIGATVKHYRHPHLQSAAKPNATPAQSEVRSNSQSQNGNDEER